MTSYLATLGARARASSANGVISADVMATAATRCLILAFGVGASVLTSRLLLPEGRGEYFWVVTAAQLLAQVSNLGLQSSNTYMVARDRARLGALLGNCLTISLVFGGTAATAAVFDLRGFVPGVPPSVWVVVALVPAMLLQLYTTNLLVGIGEIGWFNRVQLVSNLTVLAAMLAAGVLGMRATGFLVAITCAWTATSVWSASVVARHAGVRMALGFDVDIFARGLRYAAKAYLATLCGLLVLRSNVFVLQASAGYQELGYFSIAAQLADLLAILPQSVALVLFPALVSAPAAAWQRTSRQAIAVGSILAAACVAIGAAAPTLVPLAFGDAFVPSVAALQWLLPAAFFTGVTGVLSQFAAAASFPKRLVMVWAGGLALGIVCSWLLVPRYAAVGAAMALSITQGVIFLLVLSLCLQLERRRGTEAGRPAWEFSSESLTRDTSR